MRDGHDLVVVADALRTQRDRDRVGARTDRDGEAGAHPGGKLPLEGRDLLAEKEAPTAEHAGDRRVDFGGVSAVAPSGIGLGNRRGHGQYRAPWRR